MGTHPISAVLADIDGTLVTTEKLLTERAIQAVGRLRERGIVFTICSSRSPRGMRKLVEPLDGGDRVEERHAHGGDISLRPEGGPPSPRLRRDKRGIIRILREHSP